MLRFKVSTWVYSYAGGMWLDTWYSVSTCPHNVANLGPLRADIGLPVWGTPANFNRFHVLASLLSAYRLSTYRRYTNNYIYLSIYVLQRRRSPDANQTLHNLGWYTIYTFSGAFAPSRNFAMCKIHFASKSCILLYWLRYCTALQQRPSAKLCSVVQGMELRNFRRWRHLYLVGQPSRLASVHILVIIIMILTNTGSQNPSICF